MKKLIGLLKDKKLWFFAMISIIYFGVFTKLEYATDTYAVFQTSGKDMVIHFLSSGRWITALAHSIVVFFNIGKTTTYVISYIIAILCTTLSLYILEQIIRKIIDKPYISMLISILIVINAFSIELYLFIEKGILMLSVLFCILGFKELVQYFEGKKKGLLNTFIYMLLANFSYQGTVAIFIALCLVYIIKEKRDIKTFIKYNIITALEYGIPACINYVIVRIIYKNARVSNGTNFIESINKIMDSSLSMIVNSYEILPKYLFLITIVIISVLTIYVIIKKRNKLKIKILEILGIFYIIFGTFLVTIAPQLMQSTNSIWFVPRSTYAFSSLPGLLLLYYYILNNNIIIKKCIEKIISIFIIVYLLVQYNGFMNIARDRYITNYMDEYEILQISNLIKEYEIQNNIQITQIAFYEKGVSYSYPKLYSNKDTNIRAMAPEWSRLNAINYYMNRNLQMSDKNEEIENYFKNSNWQFFDKEQLVFKENTLHLYIH